MLCLAVEDPASEMSSHDVGRIERSTVSEASGDRETSPIIGASKTEKTSSEDLSDCQNPRNEHAEHCYEKDTLPGETSFGSSSSKSDDDSLMCQTDLNACPFNLPLNNKDSNLSQQPRNNSPRDQYPAVLDTTQRDLEDNAASRLADSKGTDPSCGGDQLVVGEGQTSANVRRLLNSCTIDAESHVTKLQSFVDSLAKLTEPSYGARPQPPFLPQYTKITPTKASGCIGSYSGSSVRSGFPYFGYQSPADERGLVTTPVTFLNALEQPLDLSTRKHARSANEESRGEVRTRCLERSEMLQAELVGQRSSYEAGGNRCANSRPASSELDHATPPRSVSLTAGHLTRVSPQDKHQSSDAGRYKRERTASSFGELETSKSAQMYKKSESASGKEAKQQHRSTDDSQRSSSSVAGKRKYSTLDDRSTHGGGEHSPGSETIQKCQRQSVRCPGENSHERGDALLQKKEDKEYMNMKCSCGIRFETLYQLAIHIERSGHVPGSLRPESLADLPKLVRGQDVWMSQGPEQAELILRCVQCRTSFRSLPELTIHMIRTKHYVNIVGTDGSAGQMEYGDPPWERESSQRGSLKDSKKKNDSYMPMVREVSERSMEMAQQRLQKSKSPRHSDEATDTSQIQSSYSGRNQSNLQSSFSGRSTKEGVSEIEDESDQCQGDDASKEQLPVVCEEISEMKPVYPNAVALDEPKERSRTEIRDSHSQRRHSLASKLHSKISSVTSNIQERTSSNQSTNSTYTTVSHSNSRNRKSVLKDASGIPEKVNDLGVARSSVEKHSTAGFLRTQSPECKGAAKSPEPICGTSGTNENDGNRRHKRPRDHEHETENDRNEKKVKVGKSSWKPGHQLSKGDPNLSRCLVRERQPEMAPSDQDLRKERLLLNVSRWIASTEHETKMDSGQTPIEDQDPMIDNRLELVSPPSQPVETSSILVAIKNFVDSSFCGQNFMSGSHFPSSRFPVKNRVPAGRNFSEENFPLNLIPGAVDNCESPSLSSPMKRKPHLNVHTPDQSERKPRRPTREEQVGRCSDVDDSSCKQPLAVALCNVSKGNTAQNWEEGDPEVPCIRDIPALPLRNRKSDFSNSMNLKCPEETAPQSESLFPRYWSGSEAELDRHSTDSLRNEPFPESEPNEDSSNTVELEEYSPAGQKLETISIETDNIAVDSTAKSPQSSSPPPEGIVPTAYALPEDPLHDCSGDRKSISKPISFFLSARSFEKVC